MHNIFNILKSYLKDLIYLLVIVLLCIGLTFAIKECSSKKVEYKNNIIAIHDTIHHHETPDSSVLVSIKGYQSDINDLKLLNKDLYDKINKIQRPKNVTNATYFTGSINNPKRDTTIIVKHDTITNSFSQQFNFNDEWRQLEGSIEYHQSDSDSLNISIDKDIVNFEYTITTDKQNNIFIRSPNPYVKFKEMTGFQIPRMKQKKWSLGPSINFGFDPVLSKPSFNIGISLNYGLIQF